MLLQLTGIAKQFPGVVALDDVSLSVGEGEVVGLIGENGAGKSTLMKILGGVLPADAGTIRWEDRPVTLRSASEAAALGISFVHQELNVLDNLDVAGNLFLGREPVRGRWQRSGPAHPRLRLLRLIDRKRMEAESEPHLRRLGLALSPRAPLARLAIAQRQLVEIARALAQQARLLILDEPTSSLTLAETDRLLEIVADLRRQGVSVIYITHRLGEIERCADRVVALRDGRNAGELLRAEIGHDAMVRLMVGRALKDLMGHSRFSTESTEDTETGGSENRIDPSLSSLRALRAESQTPRLEVRSLRTAARPRHAVSFSLAASEILGLAGLVGAGRSELAQAIFGVEPRLAGEILLDGRPLAIRGPRDAIDAGIYLVPEDRRRTGLVTEMSVRENITLPDLRRFAPRSLIHRDRESLVARQQLASLRIKAPSVETKVANLSGGNQQKVVLSRWLAMAPKVLIFDEPTRGIDVGAKAEIYRLMRDLAGQGVAILMISSDMEEVLGISDRVAVMHEGAITGILERDRLSEEAVMNLCVGKQPSANSGADGLTDDG
jgi:ribose transport system ATP-binding protein